MPRYLRRCRAEWGRRGQGSGRKSVWARLCCCPGSWKGEILIWIYILSQTYGTKKSLTWEKMLSAPTYTSYSAQKAVRRALSWTLWVPLDSMRLSIYLVLITDHHLYNHSDLLPPSTSCFLVFRFLRAHLINTSNHGHSTDDRLQLNWLWLQSVTLG